MTEYKAEKDDTIVNEEFEYYRLFVDGVSHYEEYLERIKSDLARQKDLAGIVKLMEMFSAKALLPKEKFRQIKGICRKDIFEFKKKQVRVYVIKQPPYIYIILADDKAKQEKSISKVESLTKDFPEKFK